MPDGSWRLCPGERRICVWGVNAGEYMRPGSGESWRKFNQARCAALPRTRQRKIFEAAKSIPYRLPELNEAIGRDHLVFIVEGEQKADALAGWKLHATCNAGGAGKWTSTPATCLKSADVIILPDNDTVGRDHAERVAQNFVGIASHSPARVAQPRTRRRFRRRETGRTYPPGINPWCR
jgi:hypothetical protein